MDLTRRSAIKALTAGAVGLGSGVVAHGYWYERHALRLVQADMPVSGLPAALEGFRIGFLTDVHHSEFVSQEEIARAVSLLMSARPDLIILGGDYVTNADAAFMVPCAEALQGLNAPAGVIAVLGNHDDDRDMPAALAAQQFTVLRDQRTTLTLRGEPVDFIGIRFWTRQPADIGRLLRGAGPTQILLAHDPRRLRQASDLAIPAVLSGHTHGGQVVLPVLGAIAARKFPHLAGFARRNDTTMFISRGVGTVYVPIRINCPPDVAVLTLTRTSTRNAERGMRN